MQSTPMQSHSDVVAAGGCAFIAADVYCYDVDCDDDRRVDCADEHYECGCWHCDVSGCVYVYCVNCGVDYYCGQHCIVQVC